MRVALATMLGSLNANPSSALRRVLLRLIVQTPWPEVPTFFPGGSVEAREHAEDLGFGVVSWEANPDVWIATEGAFILGLGTPVFTLYESGAILYPGEPTPPPRWPPILYAHELEIPGVTRELTARVAVTRGLR